MRNLKETYGDASANASLLNKLTNKGKEGGNQEKKKASNFAAKTEEDVLKLGN